MGLFPSKFIASVLATSLVFTGSAWSDPGKPKAPTAAELRQVNWEEVNRLKSSPVGQYLRDSIPLDGIRKLEKDLNASIQFGVDHGIYADTVGYRAWWNRKKTAILRPEALKAVENQSVSQTAALFYFSYVNDTAYSMEAHVPGSGQRKVTAAVERTQRESFWWVVAVGATAGFFGFIAKKFSDAFVFGPVTRVVNSLLEPVMKPVLEKVDQMSSKVIAPRMVWWQKLIGGKQGVERSGDPVKYPGTSLDESARYEKELWDALLPAQNVSNSTMPKALKEARTTGLDLLYGQFTKLSDRLQNMEVAKRTLELHFVTILKPQLGKAFTDESLEEFDSLYRWRQDILTYESQLSEKVSERDEEFTALAKKWRAAGANDDHIEKVFNYYADLYIMDNRPAFILAEYLEIERLRPEDNMALSKEGRAQIILKRQEIGRQINGVYEVLTRHKEKVEKLFKVFGTEYDVMERVNERGYPFGGDGRPRNVLPVKSCLELLLASPIRQGAKI